jgi:hypothetical protein
MSVRTKVTARCVICESDDVEHNHVGGRNHLAWFTMPFCRKHHAQFHELLRAAGVDLEYTLDPRRRLVMALKAIKVCEWMLLQALEENLDAQEITIEKPNSEKRPRRSKCA